MLFLWKLAFRNLHRHGLRSAISIMAITAVVMIVVFSRGLVLGSLGKSTGLYIDNNLGHVRIIHRDYQYRETLLTLDYRVDGFMGQGVEAMIQEIGSLEGVEHVLPRLKLGAMVSTEERMVPIIGIGVDPLFEEEYGYLVSDMIEGRMVERGDEIVVGKGLLHRLGKEPGDGVTIVFSDVYQSLQGRTLTIVGVRETGISLLDDTLLYVPLSTAQEMLAIYDEATELLVFGRDLRQAHILEERLEHLFEEKEEESLYSILVWNRADPLVALIDELSVIMDMVYLFFILLGTIVVISTLIMIIRERTREIGMMGALGLKGKEIMEIFTMEGAFMGIIGSLLGVLGGGVLTYYFSREGIHVDALAETVGGMEILIEPSFYPVFHVENLLVSFLMGAVVTILASLYPAWRAARLKPVDALRKEA